MFESLIGLVAIIALFVIISRQQSRIGLIERELGALRSLVLSGTPALPPQAKEPAANDSKPADAAIPLAAAADMAVSPRTAAVVSATEADADTTAPSAPESAQPAAAAKAARQSDVETALGTRWAVWVGGIALALGGLFLIRYTIEAGIFGPRVRLVMAAALGLVLVAGGEFIRRTGFRVPVQGAAGAYIPAILTAAGAFILFGTVYAAYSIYGFIGPTLAFTLLGAIGVATIAASLVHGQALAGVGLLGAMVTPLLVASQAPNPWALFGYLAIVLAATCVIARIRDWRLLMAAAFVATGIWTIFYMTDAPGANLAVILFIDGVTLAVLAFVWLGRRDEAVAGSGFDWPSIAPGFFVGLSALALFVDPAFAAIRGALPGAALVAALVAVALYRPRALALLHAAGLATVLVYLGIIPPTTIASDFSGGALGVDGMPVVGSDALMLRVGIALGLVFIGAGFWTARRFASAGWLRAAAWAGWSAVAPLVILLALWSAFGNLDRDLAYAGVAAVLVGVFVAGGEWIARGEAAPQTRGPGGSVAGGGAGVSRQQEA
ncbi:DUF2339 domain-containing protein, partial [Mesorhizobium sp. M0767]|uniref:DUF2339 domain-containing protein n=1 Tax=Mesorhizobium sp. M0767 TaxID=2956995 RepID=UPI003339DBCA